MKHGKLLKEASRIVEPYCITKGEEFRLKDHDPADTNGLKGKHQAQGLLEDGTSLLSHMQEKLYAQDRWALLVIFQAMDAAGKDGAIKHVMSGVNPQGVQVFSFKHPSPTELEHDFLWRTTMCLPEHGNIGIFNRSYYEEVLIVRVHPQILQGEGLPADADGRRIWKKRYRSILDFEKHLHRNGT